MRVRPFLIALLVLLAHAPSAKAQVTVAFLANWNNSGTGIGQLYGPFDISCAPDGTVLVSDQIAVKHFTGAGVFLEQWLLPPVGINAHGQAALQIIDSQGNAYFPCGFGYVQKMTLNGAPLAQWRLQQTSPGKSPDSFGIAIGSDGNVFVTDPSNRCVQKFTPDGQFLLRWGSQGSGPGQFLTCHSIAADHAGRVYVMDTGGAVANHRIEVFDLSGNFLFQFGSYGAGPGQFELDGDIGVDASGNIFVSDAIQRRVQEFGPDGNFLGIVGGEGIGDGQFQVPYGIGTDAQGNVYVCDDSYSRIQKFGPIPVAATPVSWGRIKANYR